MAVLVSIVVESESCSLMVICWLCWFSSVGLVLVVWKVTVRGTAAVVIAVHALV